MSRKTFLMALLAVFVAVSVFYFLAGRTEAESITGVILPPGYRIDRYISGLTFPTGVAWDRNGVMYVAEAVVDGKMSQDSGEAGKDGASREELSG